MNWIVGILSSTVIVVGVAAGLLYYAIDSFMEIPIDGNIFDDNDEYEDDYGETETRLWHYSDIADVDIGKIIQSENWLKFLGRSTRSNFFKII